MMHTVMSRGLAFPVVLIAGALLLPSMIHGQSVLANGGLGLPVEPIDARGMALGGVGLGIQDSYLSWTNPAETAGIPAPGLLASFQFDEFTAEFRGRENDGSTARFPLLLGAFPLGPDWSVSFGYGGLLDQNWAVQRGDTLMLSGDSVIVADRLASEGGVAAWRLGGAYRVGADLSVGLGINAYTGSTTRTVSRQFGGAFVPAESTSESSYSGLGLMGGVRWTPSPALNLSAAISRGGTLTAEPNDSTGVTSEYDLPLKLDIGASGRVGSNLLVALSAGFAGWSSANDALSATGGARDSWSVKGGLEWDAIQLGAQPLPIRIGGRVGALPFRWTAAGTEAGWVDASAVTGGIGILLAEGAVRGDFGVERGTRGGADAGIEESYWRYTLSVGVLGR